MLGFGKTRKRQFEVLCQRAGRWQTDGLFDDDKQAVSRAELLLASDKFDAVKVTSQRDGLNGGIVEADILLKERQAREKPIQLAADATPVKPCATAKDFFALDSRLAVGRLLRQFLDKLQITPTELLHSHRMIQRLDSTGNLATAAVGRVATGQAQAMKINPRQRQNDLDRLVGEARGWARDYEAERTKLPPLDRDDLSRSRRRLREAKGDELRGDHAFLCHLSLILGEAPSYAAKLDLLMALAAPAANADAVGLIDGVLADILVHAETLRDLIGSQATLAAHIGVLASVMTGEKQAQPWPEGSPMPKLAEMIAAGLLPEARRVLIERLQAALASNVLLDASQPDAELTLLQELQQRLDDGASGLIGGDATAKLIAQRRQRQHAALRRKLGLD